jgi:methylmalonyl-CoA mutase C-terminal domain/subunit
MFSKVNPLYLLSANITIEEDVDVVAMSLLNGAHLTLFPKVKALLDKQGAKNILVLGGGIIPKKDKELLETKGVYGNFGPGTPLGTIIDYIKTNVRISGGRN